MIREGAHTIYIDLLGDLTLMVTLDYEAPCAGNGGNGGWELDTWTLQDRYGDELIKTGGNWLTYAIDDAIKGGRLPEIESYKRRANDE